MLRYVPFRTHAPSLDQEEEELVLDLPRVAWYSLEVQGPCSATKCTANVVRVSASFGFIFLYF
jgi:hypothetical protein